MDNLCIFLFFQAYSYWGFYFLKGYLRDVFISRLELKGYALEGSGDITQWAKCQFID
jgi:hypothetical protein